LRFKGEAAYIEVSFTLSSFLFVQNILNLRGAGTI